ncbi:MAG: hypothetical protein V5A76_00435 [Candidatus Thermoplasmatota archaeon]
MSGKYLKARQLAKEMEEKAKKTAEKKKEAKNKKEQAEESLEIIKSLNIDIELEDLQEKFEKGEEDLDDKDFEKSYEVFRKIIEEIKSRSSTRHDEILNPIEELVQQAGDDLEFESLQEKIDESRGLFQDRELEEAFHKAFELKDESDKVINDRLNEELDNLKSILELIDEADEVKEKISKFISKAEYSLEADDYSRTLSLIKKTKETFGEEVKYSLNKTIERLRKRKEGLEEQEINVQNSEELLGSARSKLEEGKFIKAFSLIEKSKDKINPLFGEEILRDKFNKLNYKINEAEDIGAETESIKKIREEAKELQEENKIEKAESRLEDAFEEIEEAKFDKVLNTIAESREDFIKAKEMGANIEKPMQLLKKARNSLREDDHKEALDWARKGREEVQSLTKKLEEAKKDVVEKREVVNGLKEVLDEDLSDLENLIDKAEEDLEDKKTNEAISKLKKVNDKLDGEVRDKILNSVDEFDRLNKVAEEFGIDINKFSKQKEESKAKIDSSEYIEGCKIVQEGKNKVKQKIEDELDEKIPELEKSLSEFKGLDNEVKEDIDELIEESEEKINEGSYISGVEKFKEAEDMFEVAKIETVEDLIEKTSQVLSEIEEMDKDSIELGSSEENILLAGIEEAKSSMKEEMYSDALDTLNNYLLEFSEKIHTKSKNETQKAEKTGVEVEQLKKELKKSADKREEGSYTESIQISIKVMKKAEEKRKLRKEAYERIYDGSSKISELKEKNKLEEGGSIKELLEKAKKEFKQNNYSRATEKAEEAIDSLEDRDQFFDRKKELEDKFVKAKNMDIVDGGIKNFDPEIDKINEMSEDIGMAGALDKLEEKHEELEELLVEILNDKIEEVEEFIKNSEMMGFEVEDYKDQLDKIRFLMDREKSLDALIFLEKIEKEMKDIGGKEEIAKEKIEEVMVLLRKAEVMGVNRSGLEKLLHEAQKKIEEDKYEKSLQKARSAENKIRKAQKKRVESVLENFNQKIEKLNDRDVDTTLAEDKIQKAKKAKEKGDYTEGIIYAMQSEGELEKINNQKIIAGNIISRTKKFLEEVEDKGIFIDEAKEDFQECEQAYESGFYPKAVKNSLITAENLSKTFQTYNRLDSFLKSIDFLIDEFKKANKDIPKFLEEKEKIEKNYHDGKYQQAAEHMENLEGILRDHEDYLKDIISHVENEVEEEGIKNEPEAMKKLEKAKFLIDLKNPVNSLKNIEEAKELSGLKKLKRYDSLMEQVHESLENAKKFGASVERVEKRIREAKEKQNTGDVDRAYEKVEQANDMVEEILESHSPKLRVEVPDTLTINEWNPVTIQMINHGEALGENLQIELRGGELRNFTPGEKLKAGEERNINVKIKPEKENALLIARVLRIFDDEVFKDEQKLQVSMGSKLKKLDEEGICDHCGDKIKKGEKIIQCSCGKIYEISCGEEIGECKNCGTRLKTEEEKRKEKEKKRVSLDI